MMKCAEKDFLIKISTGKGERVRDGAMLITTNLEYDLAHRLENRGLVKVLVSSGLDCSHGRPHLKVNLTDKGKKELV